MDASARSALADTSGELLASGDVLFTRNVNLFVGELDGSMSETARGIVKAIDDAGVRATLDARHRVARMEQVRGLGRLRQPVAHDPRHHLDASSPIPMQRCSSHA